MKIARKFSCSRIVKNLKSGNSAAENDSEPEKNKYTYTETAKV
jgi:hypothetical protein